MNNCKNKNDVKNFTKLTKNFFEKIGGTVGHVYHAVRKNIEILDINHHDTIDVCCFEVYFNVNNIFGNGSYLDAYKRYRKMRGDWWSYLEQNGFEQWSSSTKVIGSFLPLLGSNSYKGEEYPVEKETSYGQYLVKYANNITTNEYYKDVNKRFGLEWLLQDGNKIVIGPDMGLFYGMLGYISAFKSVDTFLDIGTGSAELSAYLIKNQFVNQIYSNEISTHLKKHIEEYLTDTNYKMGGNVRIDFQFKDALEMNIPQKIDLLSLGIYYGAQPDFFRIHGKKIVDSLSDKGAVIIQSGMLEGKFNISSVVGDKKELFDWTWYKKENTVSHYFKEIKTVFVADEIITIATKTKETMEAIVNSLFSNFCCQDIPLMTENKI